jgi:hypothetical protein
VAEDQPRVSNQVQGSASGTVVQAGSIENLVLPAPSAVAAPLSMRGDLPDFTGRDDDLRRLLAVITMAGPAARAVAVHAVDGMPGVGKTAFCVHAAHELADRFPDGQIFLELHGHTPGQEPVTPERALNSLLIATGMDPKLIPTNLDDQARLWRDRTTGRKSLILLDDAASVDQVRPLLPGTADCLVLITSRHYLGGLAGARPFTLTVVPPPDGVVMLRRIAGRSGDDAVVEEIVTRWCGCLPLAIALVAARWRAHPTWDAPYLAGLLADEHDRLKHLQTGDVSVCAAFDMSLHHLTTRLRRTFHLLGALVGSEFDAYALAALTDIHFQRPGTTSKASTTTISSRKPPLAVSGCMTCCVPTPNATPRNLIQPTGTAHSTASSTTTSAPPSPRRIDCPSAGRPPFPPQRQPRPGYRAWTPWPRRVRG